MRARLAALMILALGVAAPRVAEAAPPGGGSADPKVAARAMANHGRSLYEAGKFTEAIEVLAEADKLFHAPTTVYVLARAYMGSGKLVEARAILQRVVAEQLAADAPPAFHDAQRLAKDDLAALATAIPTIQIVVHGGDGRGLRVTLDEADVAGWSPDRAVQVNPGPHRIAAVPLGGVGVGRTVELKEGDHVREQIELPTVAPVVVAPVALPPAPPPPQEGSRVPAWVSFGVGGAGLVLGIGAGVSALHSNSTIRHACGDTPVCPPSEQGALASAKGVANASTVGFVVAGVGVATGVVLLVVRPGGKAARVGIAVGPGSLGLEGAF
jgi:hypothetical protein